MRGGATREKVVDTQQISVSREDAARLHRQYQEHMHWSTPVDQEIARVYKAIEHGKMVIQALASIAAAGLGEDGLPKLAIVRADAPVCHLSLPYDGSARFSTKPYAPDAHWRCYVDLPPGSFPPTQRRNRNYFQAQTPLVPIHLRPRRGLGAYHILFEAEWRPIPPRDPMLLQRVGRGDLWIVRAAWDLTEIERAVLAGRINS
jgi:hypothetical protein